MKTVITAVLLLLLCAASAHVNAAGFIKFDGVDGESTDKEHQGWINLESFNWSMNQPAQATGQSRRRGAVIVEDLSFSKELDIASPRLAEYLANGRVTSLVQLHLTRSTDRGEEVYLRYELTNVLISSYEISWEGEGRPVENVTFNFEEIVMSYAPDEGDPVEWSWDFGGGR